jgi:Ca-activated chloride channel homolog
MSSLLQYNQRIPSRTGWFVPVFVQFPERNSDGLLKSQEAMAAEFNNSNTYFGSRRIVVKLVHTGSNLSSTIQPDLWSPATEDWITQINSDYALKGRAIISNTSCPSSASIPLGIAMWKSMAQLLGWPGRVSWNTISSLAQNPAGWGAYGRSGLGAFKFGHGHPVYSNSGRLSVVSMIHAFQNISSRELTATDVGQQAVYDDLLAIERRVFHYGKIDTDLLDRMVTRGKGYLHGVTNYESNVIRWNRQYGAQLEEPLVLLYATEGTFWNNHPLCLVDRATWSDKDRVGAAKVFQQWLLAKEQQAKAPKYGVRPAADRSIDINVEPFNEANGVVPGINIETVATLPLPQSSIVDQVISLWASVKTPAYIVLVIDTSGSMSTDNRIVYARRGGATFINQMYPQDWLRIIQFNSVSSELTNSRWGTNRTIANIRGDAVDLVSGLSAGGATALYDTVYSSWQLAQSELTNDIQNSRPRRNYGVIGTLPCSTRTGMGF